MPLKPLISGELLAKLFWRLYSASSYLGYCLADWHRQDQLPAHRQGPLLVCEDKHLFYCCEQRIYRLFYFLTVSLVFNFPDFCTQFERASLIVILYLS